MATVAAHIELKLQQLKFEAAGKVWVAFSEVRRHGEEEGIALQRWWPFAGTAQQRRGGLLVCSGASFARAATREAFGRQVR